MAIADQLSTFAADTLGGTYGNPPPVLVRNQGTYQGQCVSFIRQWFAVLGLPNQRVGNAVAYWKSAYMELYFDRVTDGSHQDGDILIWEDDIGTWTGPDGHIAIWFGGNILNQNWNSSLRVSINKFFSPGYVGSYRLKGENEMINDTNNEYNRWAITSKYIRSRVDGNNQLVALTREEFQKAAVGKTWLTALEILEDNNSEASDTLGTLQMGEDAQKGDWVGQIHSLQAVVADKDAQIAELQKEVDAGSGEYVQATVYVKKA